VQPSDAVQSKSFIPPAFAKQLLISRVVVLPFVNLSPDPNEEYFADGMTEELIDKLSQVKEFQVIARTSAMSYKKKDRKAGEIGREFRVGAMIEGSVRKAGNKIRVTVQLIDPNTIEIELKQTSSLNVEGEAESAGGGI
jgi:adenylate cyclase